MTWRPLPQEYDSTSPISRGLDALAKRLGAPPAAEMNAVFANWPEIVGEQLAEHARPIGMKQGRVIVEVDDSRWATQMKWLAPQVIKQLNSKAENETVEGLDIRVSR